MRTKKALTLIELLVIVLIIGALSAIAIPRISSSTDRARGNVCMANVDVLNSQTELYMANEGVSSLNLSDVTGNPDYFPDGALTCPFGTSYVMNGTTYRVAEHPH